jgi:hypothetical protein
MGESASCNVASYAGETQRGIQTSSGMGANDPSVSVRKTFRVLNSVTTVVGT